MTKTKIGVLGAGTWGTALARMLAGNGCDVTMWSALPDELKAMSVTHAHPNLPGMCLPADMHYTADIEEICGDRDVLRCPRFLCVPPPARRHRISRMGS